MKRKRQESDEEQSSDDTASKTEREAKAHKTQGYSSPLIVINENELLDCSVTNEAGKLDGAKRTTRANRASRNEKQSKRKQPKRGSQKNNLPDVGGSAEDQTSDSSSMDDKPRRNTRNSRKKNSELARVIEENGSDSVITTVDDSTKRVTRNTRKKPQKETVEVSYTKELQTKPAKNKSQSNVATISKDCGEFMAWVAVEQEPASPFDKIPERRSTRNSRHEEESVDSEKKETENRAHVPETPEPVVENVMSSPKSAKTCKATINLDLQSPGFTKPACNRAGSETTSSPQIEQDLGSREVTAEENGTRPEEEANKDVVTVCSSTPKQPQESPESHGQAESENKEELENGEVENGNEPDSDAIDGNVEASKGDVDKENTRVADPRAKSGRKSMQRSSGWRRKSKRSSHCLISPVNKRSINRTVTKSKTPGKKSIIKSSVKLNLAQSKLMPELKINTGNKCGDVRSPDPSLADVRVCLFDNLTSESSTSGASSATTSSSSSSVDDKVEAASSSSCSSAEDKAEAPVERIMEELAEDDSEEVFHDCRGSENEADDETENVKCTKTNGYVHCKLSELM